MVRMVCRRMLDGLHLSRKGSYGPAHAYHIMCWYSVIIYVASECKASRLLTLLRTVKFSLKGL